MLSLVRSQIARRAQTACVRPLATSARILSASRAPAAAHPSAHKPRALDAGKPVSELANEREDTPSGTVDADAPLARVPLPDLFSLRDRTVIVTGGGRGLGLTLARAVLEAGAHVRALDLLATPTEPAWSAAAALAAERGLSLQYAPLDVTSEPDVRAAVADAFASAPRAAPVRGLFHAAGIQLLMAAADYTPAQFRKIVDVNLNGSFLVAQAFAREHAARPAGGGSASIVLVGSMSGSVANYGLECAAYNASKAGVNQLARCLAMEWGPAGVRVNSLSPGYIRTAMTAALLAERPDFERVWLQGSLLGRLSTPDEFRGPVVYLLSDASSFMTGADLIVDGGHTAT